MSVIFHIDVNSAFLSWSALQELENGSTVDLRTIPSIVGGDQEKRHGIVLAKSIPAKVYGIQTAEPVVNAFRKCPALTMVPPDHEMYSRRSEALMQYLSRISPDLEQVSIDECYMDFTPIAQNYTSPQAAAVQIKDSIYETFGFTVNIGISDRKVLAKMASDFKKPNLVHTLYSHEIREKLWPLPVSSLFMCGRSSAESLRNLGIQTIGDLAQTPQSIVTAHLKSHGITLWEYANGIDNSKVGTIPAKMKGIGNSTTLSEDVITKEHAYTVLLQLAESVGTRLRAAHESASMISTEIKYATFRSVSHQTGLPIPTSSTDEIYKVACQLFNELWDGTPIRLLGIRSSKLTSDSEPTQLSLFDISQGGLSITPDQPDISASVSSASFHYQRSEKQKKLDKALDSLRGKYGKDIIKRGSLMNKSEENT